MVFSNVHCKLKVNCTILIPNLKLKFINKTFDISKSKGNCGKKLKLKPKLNFDTKITLYI